VGGRFGEGGGWGVGRCWVVLRWGRGSRERSVAWIWRVAAGAAMRGAAEQEEAAHPHHPALSPNFRKHETVETQVITGKPMENPKLKFLFGHRSVLIQNSTFN
jgi:hypothetical protein